MARRVVAVKRIMRAVSTFFGDRSGNFTILFALAIVPAVGIMGLAIDYGLALRERTALNAAADSAALAALNVVSNIMNGSTNNSFSAAKSAAETAGTNVFNVNAQPYSTTSVSVTVSQDSSNPLLVNTNVMYNAQSPNQFGQIFGFGSIALKGSSMSSVTLNRYINIYLLVDISQSMGIAGSSQDMATLYAKTASTPGQGGGCVFGCHVLQPGQSVTNEVLAHNNGITLRIDIIKTAIADMITRASNANTVYPLDKIGIYTLEQGLGVIQDPPTADTTTLTNQLTNIDLGTHTTADGVGDSWSSVALSALAARIPANGNGTSASPENYVFILTDGTSDIYSASCPSNHCVTPYSQSWCTGLQNVATVGVIYTTYLPIYENNDPTQGLEGRYTSLILPIASQINPQLKSCTTSSGNWFFEASSKDDIDTALNTLFAQATAGARLTN